MSIEKERISNGGFVPKWVRREHHARFEFAAQYVQDKIVVDCACGSGVGSKIFALAGAKQVLAYDLSADDVYSAQAGNYLSNLVYAVGEATALPSESGLADVYISLETIEHLVDDAKFLVEVKRVLKPSGVFICSTPNRAVTNPRSQITDKPWNKFHTREYSYEEFENLLKKYFDSVEIFGQNSKSRWRIKASNLIAKIFSTHVAVRFNQILKLPRLIFDSAKSREVKSIQPDKECEYLVAVCK
ncbi:MAG: class I SAM-dependent methyltransferase [Candidatus Magasanikbacteria bacterium]